MNQQIYTYLESVATEARMNRAKETPSALILETTDRAAAAIGMPPVMTYEGLILLNPLEESPIIFSNTEFDMENELLFYRTHRDIELALYPAIQGLLDILASKNDEAQDMEIDLSGIKNNIRVLLTKALNLKENLNSGAFSRFREFFRGIPYRNLNGVSYPGASGAYSAGIPALDTLFGIEKLPMLSPIADEIRPRLVNDTYATVDTMRKSVDLVMREGTLMEKFAGNTRILEQLKECVKIIHAYRMLHKASAEKLIPETTTMQDSGTGGALNVPAYLNAGIENTRKVLN